MWRITVHYRGESHTEYIDGPTLDGAFKVALSAARNANSIIRRAPVEDVGYSYSALRPCPHCDGSGMQDVPGD